MIDTYVETLCGHSTHKYLFDGKCRKMQFFDAGTLNPGTKDAKEITYYRTVHGPVFGYARVHGRLVALSRKRSSYGKDVLDQLLLPQAGPQPGSQHPPVLQGGRP